MLAKKPKGATEKKTGSGLASLLWMFVGALLTLMIGLFLYLWNPFDMGGQTASPSGAVQPINQQTTEGNDYEFYELLPEQEVTNIPDEAIVEQEPLEEVTLDPDVVVNASESQDAESPNSPNNNTQEYGISEDTINNPMQSQTPQSVQGDGEIAIIEEEGTYDAPAITSPSSSTEQPATNENVVVAIKPTYILQINSFSSAEEADKRRAQVLMAGVDARVVKNQSNDQTLYQVVSAPMKNREVVIAAQQKLQNNGIDSLIVEQRR